VGVERSDGTIQQETNLCYQGFMSDGSFGWYQVDATCGNGKTGWRFFNGNAGVFCCLDFEANLGPTEPPAIPVYVFDGAWVYPYGNADAALAGCQAVDERYGLCSDDQVVELTVNGATVDDAAYDSVDPIANNLSGWTSSDDNPVGRYVNGGWNSWTSGGNAGAHCCIVDMIEAAPFPDVPDVVTVAPTELPTEPVTTEPEVTTTSPTELPTEFVPYSDLPSTLAQPDGCVDRPDLIPEGFDNVIFYCATTDLIYVNGRSTCVNPNDVDSDTLVLAAFETNWYFAHDSDNCDDLKSYDMATDDQLFVTNHMLDNLQEDIDAAEESMATQTEELDSYFSNWKKQVAALIAAGNFDDATAAALQQYVDNNLSDN